MGRWTDRVRQHSGWLLVLAGGLLLPLITDLGASWLEATFGQTPAHLIRLLAVVAALAAALWVIGLALRPRSEPMDLVPGDARPEYKPGLIALVGRGRPGQKLDLQDQAAVKAIEYHLNHDGSNETILKICWLIATTGETGSVPVARQIQQAYDGPQCKVVIREVGNPFSVQDTYDTVQRIYNEEIPGDELETFELKQGDVIADFTSGTAPMTAGLALACGQVWPMQYTVGRKAKGETDIASVPILVRFKPGRRKLRV